jgi:glycosyltransferase involved in cell wall biosynthesis
MGGRIANYLTYGALSTAVACAHPADVVLAMTDPPFAGTIGAIAARLRRRPLVYWVQDLHPDIGVEIGMVRNRAVLAAWRKAQQAALRSATSVVVLGQDMAERVIGYGVDPSVVTVVPNGAPLGAEPEPRDLRHPVSADLRDGHQFVVMHAGNLGFAGAWSTLVEAAGMLRGRSVGMVFVGDGAQRADLERKATASPNVTFRDYRPRSEVPLVLAAGDLHVVTVRAGLEGLVVPSKLYGLLAAGRPILAVTPDASEAARLVRRHRCGIVADPSSAASVAAAVSWAQDHPDELAAMGQRARQAAFEYDRPAMLVRLVEVAEAAARRTAAGRPRP